MPEISEALDAKVEWTKMTNPYGSGEKKSEPVANEFNFLADIQKLPGTKVHGK